MVESLRYIVSCVSWRWWIIRNGRGVKMMAVLLVINIKVSIGYKASIKYETSYKRRFMVNIEGWVERE